MPVAFLLRSVQVIISVLAVVTVLYALWRLGLLLVTAVVDAVGLDLQDLKLWLLRKLGR